MNSYKSILYIVCSIVIGLASARSYSDENIVRSINTTVCELAEAPAEYDEKLVIIRGIVESDGLEYENLLDARCPHFGIDLEFSKAAQEQKDVAKLQSAIYKARPIGTKSLKITATVTGIFQAPIERRPRSVSIESITNLKIENWDIENAKPWKATENR